MTYPENIMYERRSIEGHLKSHNKKTVRKFPKNEVSSVEEAVQESSVVSSTAETDFLNKPLVIVDELNGLFRGIVKNITEQPLGKICIYFDLVCNKALHPVKAYTSCVIHRGNALFRLADALDILDDDGLTLSDFLNQKLWLSVKTNTVDNKVYENVIDFANIGYKRDELQVNEKGYFIYED